MSTVPLVSAPPRCSLKEPMGRSLMSREINRKSLLVINTWMGNQDYTGISTFYVFFKWLKVSSCLYIFIENIALNTEKSLGPEEIFLHNSTIRFLDWKVARVALPGSGGRNDVSS